MPIYAIMVLQIRILDKEKLYHFEINRGFNLGLPKEKTPDIPPGFCVLTVEISGFKGLKPRAIPPRSGQGHPLPRAEAEHLPPSLPA